MGDVHKRNVHLPLQAFQLQLHLLAQLQVQRAQRLVQQQHAGLVHQTAGDGHTLLLAAGQLVDAAALVAFQTHRFQHFQHLGTDDVLRQLFQTQAEGHILKHVEMREQRVFLEHRVHLPLIGRQIRNVLAIKKDIAGSWGDKACNHAQSRGFSTARWAKEGDELLVVNVQRKAVQNLFTIKINNNVFERYDQIFIHLPCIPLCGNFPFTLRCGFFLRSRVGFNGSAPIMPPRKGLLHGQKTRMTAAVAHTTPMCQGIEKFALRCNTQDTLYSVWGGCQEVCEKICINRSCSVVLVNKYF